MKSNIFKLFIVISWIVCLGHIIIGFPMDTFVMRAITGLMSIFFSCSLLFLLLKIIDKKRQKKMVMNE